MKKEMEQHEEQQSEEKSAPKSGTIASAAIAAVAVAGLAVPATAAAMPQADAASVEQAQPAELTGEALDQLLQSADLKAGKSVRVIKALEIRPGAVISRQYDR